MANLRGVDQEQLWNGELTAGLGNPSGLIRAGPSSEDTGEVVILGHSRRVGSRA